MQSDLPIEEEALYAPCDFCPTIINTANICVQCSRRYCEKHTSPVKTESNKCIQCVPYGPGESTGIAEFISPLVDAQNHIHKGRRIVPTGEGYKTLPRAISEMTEDELNKFIAETGARVHEIEKQRDYLKVGLTTALLERDDRVKEDLALKKAYKIKPQAIKIVGGGNGKIKGVAGVASGINIKDFLKFAGPALAKLRQKGGPGQPPSITGLSPASAKAAAPKDGGVSDQTPGGSEAPPVAATTSLEEIAQQAREAEIEAILDGGEPQSIEMKDLLKPLVKEICDNDIPF